MTGVIAITLHELGISSNPLRAFSIGAMDIAKSRTAI